MPLPPRRRRLPSAATTLVVVALLAAAGFGGWRYLARAEAPPAYRLAKVERGSITATVSASGTLNAVTTVQVGSTISGQIREILVDFNTQVKQGELLARIDPETFEFRVKQAEADLEAARTSLLQRESEAASQRSQIVRAQITHEDAKRDLERKESLLAKNFISTAERDKAVFVERGAAEAVRTVQAQLRAAEALVANGRAVIKQREAALLSARNDLSKTAITAPVDGVVISRQVEPGQTVAASLNTPTLFTIAQDLREMQVDVAIDESDIGRIRPEQRATYTVDAFPGRTFEGRVRQIRKAAQTVQNVVTYIVVVGTQNPGLQLVPGMTANVRIVTDQRDDILKVPNAALRWRPAGVGNVPADAPPAAPGAGAGNGPGGADVQARRQRLIDELKLDGGQVARLDEILGEQRSRFAALRELPESDRRPRAERIRAEVRLRISGLLNDEQRKLYAEIVAAETGRGTGVSGTGRLFVPTAGAPSELRVRTGLTDGNATEVASPQLAEGQEVIVGTQQSSSSAPRAGGSAPRLPF